MLRLNPWGCLRQADVVAEQPKDLYLFFLVGGRKEGREGGGGEEEGKERGRGRREEGRTEGRRREGREGEKVGRM